MGASASINFGPLQSVLSGFLCVHDELIRPRSGWSFDELVRRLTNCSSAEGFASPVINLDNIEPQGDFSHGIAD
ncbi:MULTISPECIES: hypothetical protein [unclassified Mesorhizobium]|uniref:hypothetical protein n=1 Tax=unclassified Mesorhizobium TaxID=325217 RepID=UPI0015E3B143|nr:MULTISPECIES: hypothetical protein [unclassified Mesorhizobium]MBZ9813884.1 hypothetical protein [Mesorhizobium sp. CA7]MBZ9859056.1 hypothetical protein [Mesorhizobium sp. CA12]MBZ9900003.1 hypothetical protein [Mesorhizobium sp. CA17]